MEDWTGMARSQEKIPLKDEKVETFLPLALVPPMIRIRHLLLLFNLTLPRGMPIIEMHSFIVSCLIEIWKLKQKNKHPVCSN